jgi:hypothetical protein
MPDRPRSVPALIAAGLGANQSIRRWRLRHSWDARTAAWDMQRAGAGVMVDAPDEWPEGDDQVSAARAYAQQRLPDYLRVLHGVAVSEEQKPHLRVAAALALVELAGVTKLSRPKIDPADPLRAARALADTVAGRIDPDQAMALLEGMDVTGARPG